MADSGITTGSMYLKLINVTVLKKTIFKTRLYIPEQSNYVRPDEGLL
jgi:hypothetical protein